MIRRMELSDLGEVLDIWLSGNCSAHNFIASSYWEGHIDYMREILPRADVWVYTTRGRVVGFVGLDGEYIAGLFVSKESRSNGIGTKLLHHVISLHDSLQLCVYEKNTKALNLYTRIGFEIVEHRLDTATGEMELLLSYRS